MTSFKVAFMPGPVDDNGKIPDQSTQKFLQALVDQFASRVTRFATNPAAPDIAA